MATKPQDLTKPQSVAGALAAMTPASLTGTSPVVKETNAFLPSANTAAEEAAPSVPASWGGTSPTDDRNVEQRLNGILAGDSDYIKMARMAGLKTANARGLLNSSMAAGASEGAAIERALPIATADAQIAAQKSLSREEQAAQMARLVTQGQQSVTLQGMSDTAAFTRLQTQLASSDSQQDKDIAAQMLRLKTDSAAQMERLQSQLQGADAQQARDIAAQMERLRASTDAEAARLSQAAGYDMERLHAQAGIDLTRDAAQATNAQELSRVQGTIQAALQSQGNAEQIQRMGVELSNQLQINSQQLSGDLSKIAASGDQQIRQLVEAANQERVTLQQSIAAQDRQAMASAMVNIFQIEAQMRSALLGNDKIAASERAAYERTISSMGDPIRAYINQLFGSSSGNGLDPTGAITAPTGSGSTGNGLAASPLVGSSSGGEDRGVQMA